VLRTKVGFDIFNFISLLARELLGFAGDGVEFLTDDTVTSLPWFLTGVIPAIIFFIALVQMLYYWGIIQWFIGKFAVFFFWSMKVSGAEAVVAAATPFIGQGESAMLIKPFVQYLTKAEIHQIMSCGFATIAGSVLIAYINLGLNPQVLVSSCIMSIPASLALSHLRYPEEEETLTAGKIVVPKDDTDKCQNVLEALANGAWLGIKIAGMIVSTLLVIIALLHLVSGLLTWWGRYLGLNGEYDLTVQLIVGYICYPIAFLLGVPRRDILHVARLIGLKIVAVSNLAPSCAAMALSARDIQLTSITERICCFQGTRHRTRLHRHERPRKVDCHIQSVWLRQHRLAGHPDWCALADCPEQDRRCRLPRRQRAYHRHP
jgi:CNT family concentrative nucleoside transporter